MSLWLGFGVGISDFGMGVISFGVSGLRISG